MLCRYPTKSLGPRELLLVVARDGEPHIGVIGGGTNAAIGALIKSATEVVQWRATIVLHLSGTGEVVGVEGLNSFDDLASGDAPRAISAFAHVFEHC